MIVFPVALNYTSREARVGGLQFGRATPSSHGSQLLQRAYVRHDRRPWINCFNHATGESLSLQIRYCTIGEDLSNTSWK
jgi:hypothetical protein